MTDIKRGILKFYGNRKLMFDILVSLLIVVCLFFSNIVFSFSGDMFFSLIEFLGILAGFLLTAFSILYIYNPTESKLLSKFRKHPMFINMLRTFISTILFALVSVLLIYFELSTNLNLFIFNYVLIFFVALTFMRILKCIYYLFVIVDIGQSQNKYQKQ